MPNVDLNKHQLDASKEVLRNAPGHSEPFADQIGNYQRNIGLPEGKFKNIKVYISGSGIAGLSAAYYLIRDGQIPGENITFLEQLDIEGGSLDGAGDAEKGFIVRGGREMDFTYENFWDMFQDIPAVELPEPYSILDEYRLCNDNDPNYSKARLIHNKGEVKDFSKLGISKKDQLAVVKLLLKKKDELDDMTIEDYFSKDFLESNFWTFWRTMFAFENWQSLLELKLYMHRFLHAIDGLNDMSSLVFPKYNQYDTFVKPLREFLVNKGVKFQFSTIVKDLEFQKEGEESYVNAVVTEQGGSEVKISLNKEDLVFVTTGSMTEDTRYADSNTTPKLDFTKENMGTSTGWTVWNNLAKKSEIFGKPEKFNKNVEKSAWMSATLTCKPSAFTEKLKEYCINDPYSGKTATGGIITITDSNWLMSFTINRQPHFPTQPKDTLVVWAYALLIDKKGNFIEKTMPECTGHEILSELAFHLGLEKNLDDIKEKTIVRTAYMPYITSMFMPRAKGDRPEIVPAGYKNLGLLGQFVETANDVVFTMESSVRSARVAVYTLLDSNKKVPDINPLQYDIRHLLKAANTLNDNRGFPGSGLLHKVLKNTYFEHILPEIEEDDEENKSFLAQQWENLKNIFLNQSIL